MALKSITLTVSDRQILQGVLSRQADVKVKSARMIRELANSFKTEATTKMLDRLNDEAKGAAVAAPTWDDLMNLGMYLGVTNEKLASVQPAVSPIVLKDWERALVDGLEAEIDTMYLEWIRDKLAEVEWSKAKMTLQTGEQKIVDVPVSVGQAIAIACAADAIDRAIAS